MKGNRRWLGWIAIGIGALALVVALAGRGFGSQVASAGMNRPVASQSQAQPGAGMQNAGPQGGQFVPGDNQSGGAGAQNAGPQAGPNAQGTGRSRDGGSQANRGGGEGQRGPGRSDGGFGLGGLFHFPIKLLSGALQMGLLALLVIAGLWLLRGRSAGGTVATANASPADVPPAQPESPTGESYVDEDGNRT